MIASISSTQEWEPIGSSLIVDRGNNLGWWVKNMVSQRGKPVKIMSQAKNSDQIFILIAYSLEYHKGASESTI